MSTKAQIKLFLTSMFAMGFACFSRDAAAQVARFDKPPAIPPAVENAVTEATRGALQGAEDDSALLLLSLSLEDWIMQGSFTDYERAYRELQLQIYGFVPAPQPIPPAAP